MDNIEIDANLDSPNVEFYPEFDASNNQTIDFTFKFKYLAYDTPDSQDSSESVTITGTARIILSLYSQ